MIQLHPPHLSATGQRPLFFLTAVFSRPCPTGTRFSLPAVTLVFPPHWLFPLLWSFPSLSQVRMFFCHFCYRSSSFRLTSFSHPVFSFLCKPKATVPHPWHRLPRWARTYNTRSCRHADGYPQVPVLPRGRYRRGLNVHPSPSDNGHRFPEMPLIHRLCRTPVKSESHALQQGVSHDRTSAGL